MDSVKRHFNEEALDCDQIILTLIPEYPRMVRTLVGALPFDRTAAIQTIDLGCGTGTIAKTLLESFPSAHVTCVDLAENMLAAAQSKLARYPSVEYIVADRN